MREDTRTIEQIEFENIVLASQLFELRKMAEWMNVLKDDLRECWDEWGSTTGLDNLIKDESFFITEKYKHASDTLDSVKRDIKSIGEDRFANIHRIVELQNELKAK